MPEQKKLICGGCVFHKTVACYYGTLPVKREAGWPACHHLYEQIGSGFKENRLMEDKSIIERLKKNQRPFGLMDEEMREKAKEIRKKEFSYFIDNHWNSAVPEIGFASHKAYRLRDDYEEECPECHGKGYTFHGFHMVPKSPCSRGCKEKGGESEIVECEILPPDDDDMKWVRISENYTMDFTSCEMHKDFIGFKFEDGTTAVFPLLYKCPKRGEVFTSTVDDILPNYIVLHATHVLFRRQT